MLELIEESSCAEIALIIKTPPQPKHKAFLYGFYEKLENKLFTPQPNASAIKSADSLLLDIPTLEFQNPTELDAMEKIQKEKLDVIVNTTSAVYPEEFTKVADLGIWSYIHGDLGQKRLYPPGLIEVFKGQSEIVANLLMQRESENRILYQSYSMTDHISRNRCANPSLIKSSTFVIRQLSLLHKIGKEVFLKEIKEKYPEPIDIAGKKIAPPANIPFIFYSIRLIVNFFFGFLERKFNNMEQWCLLFSQKKEDFSCMSMNDFQRITPPKDRFWADPFVVFKNNKHYIFLEECLFSDPANAYLSVMEVNEDGTYSEPIKFMDKDYHLSYPFIFVHDNEYYMIPESGQNKTIELYKCSSFPNKWEFEMNLMEDVKAYDSTLFYKDKKWWLFCNMKEADGASSFDELFLFFADDFKTDNWTPHPMNPVISDVKCSRPAGKIFEFEGKICRPSQNSSHSYGYGLKINEIQTLNEQEYREETIQSIEPDWDKKALGCHTLNFAENFTVMDAVIKRKK